MNYQQQSYCPKGLERWTVNSFQSMLLNDFPKVVLINVVSKGYTCYQSMSQPVLPYPYQN